MRGGGALDQGGGSGNIGLEITGTSRVGKAQGWVSVPKERVESEKGTSGSSEQHPLHRDNQRKDAYKEAGGVGQGGKVLSPKPGVKSFRARVSPLGPSKPLDFSPVRSEGSFDKVVG